MQSESSKVIATPGLRGIDQHPCLRLTEQNQCNTRLSPGMESLELRFRTIEKVEGDCKSCSISLLITLNSDLSMTSSLVRRSFCLLFSTFTLVVSSFTRRSSPSTLVPFGSQLLCPYSYTLSSLDDISLFRDDIVRPSFPLFFVKGCHLGDQGGET
jgi:hypothetical protein